MAEARFNTVFAQVTAGHLDVTGVMVSFPV